ncbi:MAG: tetratricopeptide repeat protein [Phycisphaerales bacterium]|nr:tetratricopeptide repeat protein [Phycisphaerales bacterium]
MRTRRSILPALLLSACALMVGCANPNQKKIDQAVNDYFIGNYEQARQILRPLANEQNQDFVLNNLRLASVCLTDYHLIEAESAFLRAYEVINAVGVTEGGRSLGAVLVDEKIKVWKGEPFERAMANFYLGMIYYMKQDYLNARAAFENSLFKLRDYGEEADSPDQYAQVESNFTAAWLMLGRCWQRIGREDQARAAFARMVQLRPDLASLADYDRNLGANVVLFVDVGYGPQKVTDESGSLVGFAPMPAQEGPIPLPRVLLDNRYVNIDDVDRPMFDLLALAQDRRWQSIDTIRAVKSTLGTGLIMAGAAEGVRGLSESGSAQRRDLIASAVLLGVGILLKASSQADLRQWEMLPRTTYVLPMRLPPGRHDLTIEIPALPGLHQTWRNVDVPATGQASYYFRLQRWNSGLYDWPPPALTDQPPPLIAEPHGN